MREDTATIGEAELLRALQRGDEDAFRQLVRLHQASLRRVAGMFAPAAVADEVVQETWVAVITGIDRFEGRSSVKTWIYRILLNLARRRGPRERRTVPFSAQAPFGDGDNAADPDRLVHPELGEGYWPAPPAAWHEDPEGRLLGAEVRGVVRTAMEALPPAQREVMTLRDIEHWTSQEVCDLLDLTAVNQRVLLHRARVTVRRSLEEYLDAS